MSSKIDIDNAVDTIYTLLSRRSIYSDDTRSVIAEVVGNAGVDAAQSHSLYVAGPSQRFRIENGGDVASYRWRIATFAIGALVVNCKKREWLFDAVRANHGDMQRQLVELLIFLPHNLVPCDEALYSLYLAVNVDTQVFMLGSLCQRGAKAEWLRMAIEGFVMPFTWRKLILDEECSFLASIRAIVWSYLPYDILNDFDEECKECVAELCPDDRYRTGLIMLSLAVSFSIGSKASLARVSQLEAICSQTGESARLNLASIRVRWPWKTFLPSMGQR